MLGFFFEREYRKKFKSFYKVRQNFYLEKNIKEILDSFIKCSSVSVFREYRNFIEIFI